MKDHNIGCVVGVFDLFHIGHLNLIRKSKEKCEYLIVGVLTDELIVHFKGKKSYIPFEERLEIVGVLEHVDKTIGTTTNNIDKMTTWELYKPNCLFSGGDYVNNESWIIDKERLNQVEADIHFFPYMKSTSSTQIKEVMGRRRCLWIQE